VPSVLDLECHLQQIVVAHPSAKDVAADRLTELRNRFERIMDVNSDQFNPIPAAACLLNPTVAAVMLIPEQAPLLHAAKLMIIRLCEGHGTAWFTPVLVVQQGLMIAVQARQTWLRSFRFWPINSFSLPTPPVIAVTVPKQ
jgi:hypothetical protein